MEQFNKALSFILGLVVVAVFIVVASGKFNFKNALFPKSQVATNGITPTVTPKPTSKPWFSFNQPTAKPTPKPTSVPKTNVYTMNTTNTAQQQDPNYHSYSGSTAPTSIPNTGVPFLAFPLFGSSLLTGIFMKKKGQKKD